ncbi:MAG: sugar phosphate isomerase/epimerase [Anaerolineaceae bacterium]|nr:sugar phosphate isomerase/epimerase [Anaerolineaceae bacterium]
MQLAIQEDMLPGRTILEKFQQAKKLGLDGIEFWGYGLTAKVPEIAAAIEQTGVVAASVNHGRQGRLLSPDRVEREAALEALRQSIVNAVDIGAQGVIVAPHFGPSIVPDFTPYKSVRQLEYELLHNHLRSLADYVYAIGVELYIEPINRYETAFLNTLADAAEVRRLVKNHPHVKIVADLFHMALEEHNMATALREFGADIGHVHLADSNRRLPGHGLIDFAGMAAALTAAGYTGWAAFECGEPGANQGRAGAYWADLPASIALLKTAGF